MYVETFVWPCDLEELAQGRHRHLVPAADVDAAQEDEVSGQAAAHRFPKPGMAVACCIHDASWRFVDVVH